MRIGLVLLAALSVGAAGCTDKVDMAPLNAQAQAVGSPRLAFFRGLPGGVMKVTMPDGEVLPGTFSVSETAPITPASTATPDAGDGGNFHATAQGPRTSLVCSARLVGGHGPGQCRAQDGAVYQLNL